MSFLVWNYSPEDITDLIGEEHAYIALFLSALLGGTSIFIPFPYYLVTISLGAAGFNPLSLAIVAALGTAIGDTTTYFIARSGRIFTPSRARVYFSRIVYSLKEKHPSFVPFFTFLYAAFLPLPDDLIMAPAGFVRYPFKRIILSLFLGKVVFNGLLAFAGLYGWERLVLIFE
ncbi:MAG: VTT domain-containing protein [Candidatus Moraniibacteriota bacterium]|nr:MAG: VTT domain-containing protein [Candidatus Moranbacteria bacterium]